MTLNTKVLSVAALVLCCVSETQAETADECLERLKKAGEIGLVLDVKLKKFSAHVVVDEPTWKLIDFNTKTGLSETVDCAILGPGTHDLDVVFHSNLTDHVLGTYTRGKLTVEGD